MHVHAWAHSTSDDGARSAAIRQFLDGALRLGSMYANRGVTIAIDQIVVQDVPCLRLNFNLPQTFHSRGITSIPVLLPTACLGAGTYRATDVFCALVEEIIGWIACVGPKHTLLRLYRDTYGQPLARSRSSGREELHCGFALFIRSLRESHQHFPGQGQISGAFGTIEVTLARTSSQQVSGDYIVTLTLSNRQRMSLFLPRSVAQLGDEWRLDWLEVQNEFSS
jgi:hypothetical protein